MVLGGILKIIINYFLVANPDINISGAPIGTNACYILILTLNIFWIVKLMKVDFSVSEFIVKPVLCVAAMGAAVIGTMSVVSSVFASSGRIFYLTLTLVCVAAGAITYGIMLFVTRLITYDDVLMLPKGEKIANYMLKFRLIKR